MSKDIHGFEKYDLFYGGERFLSHH
jgi:hypothetical protein